MGATRRRRRSGSCHRHHHRLSFATATALAFLLFASSASAVVVLHPTRQLGGRVVEEGEDDWRKSSNGSGREVLEYNWGRAAVTRRRLGGLGSSPPTCRSKCGRCAPCRPVRVPIHPGFSMPLEYYPEAWRCKCGKQLFMP